jgi:hypothetical protein
MLNNIRGRETHLHVNIIVQLLYKNCAANISRVQIPSLSNTVKESKDYTRERIG